MPGIRFSTRNRLTNPGDSDLCPHRGCPARERQRVLNFISTRAWYRLDNRQEFTRFALLKTINHRLIERFQWTPAHRADLEPAGYKRNGTIIRSGFDVMAQLLDHF